MDCHRRVLVALRRILGRNSYCGPSPAPLFWRFCWMLTSQIQRNLKKKKWSADKSPDVCGSNLKTHYSFCRRSKPSHMKTYGASSTERNLMDGNTQPQTNFFHPRRTRKPSQPFSKTFSLPVKVAKLLFFPVKMIIMKTTTTQTSVCYCSNCNKIVIVIPSHQSLWRWLPTYRHSQALRKSCDASSPITAEIVCWGPRHYVDVLKFWILNSEFY